MPKLTLTTGAILGSPVSSLVADPGSAGGGVIRPVRTADRRSNGYIVTPENFSVLASNTPTSRFDRAVGRIFSTALNRFSITLSGAPHVHLRRSAVPSGLTSRRPPWWFPEPTPARTPTARAEFGTLAAPRVIRAGDPLTPQRKALCESSYRASPWPP